MLGNWIAYIISYFCICISVNTMSRRGIKYNQLDFWIIVLGAGLGGVFASIR